jgi:hypothetical protein
MAWTAPRTFVAAELVTASMLNTHLRDNLNELRAGGLALSSQTGGDFLYAASSTQVGRLAAGGAFTSIRRNAAGTAYEFFRPEAPRVSTCVATQVAPTPNANTDDQFDALSMSVNMVFGTPTGSPVNGQRLLIRILDNGAARTIGWSGGWRSAGPALPTTTTAFKWMHLLFRYNANWNYWDLLGAAQDP